MKNPGQSNPSATKEFAEAQIKNGKDVSAYRTWHPMNWKVSSLGFGCYRIDDDDPIYSTAMEKALRAGINLIDTSTNYGDGESEVCVGSVLEEGIKEGAWTRDGIVVVSKVGYVQGQNLALAVDREKSGSPFPEMVKYMDGCWHCIHPDFIADQLSRSLNRLHFEKLDVYLLHNPEYYLSDAHNRKEDVAVARKEFYRRIESAFTQLEKEVSSGKIQYYGVSSNTFAAPDSRYDATSLPTMWEIAERVGGKDHHFRVTQLPFNLFESGPLQGFLQFAREKNIVVLANRPLNAIINDRLTRLADFPRTDGGTDFASLREKVGELEKRWREEFAPAIKTPEDGVPAKDFFVWSENLKEMQNPGIALDQWNHYRGAGVVPQVRYLFDQLERFFAARPEKVQWTTWRRAYAETLDRFLDSITKYFFARAQVRSDAIAAAINPFLPENLREKSLSQKSLAVLANTPGVHCVLNGMRAPHYVDDSTALLNWPAFPVEPGLYQKVSTL